MDCDELTTIHAPQMTLPQQSRRRFGAVDFSVFSSYKGSILDRSVAQVQHTSSAILETIPWNNNHRKEHGLLRQC